jgi:hypothetical protein
MSSAPASTPVATPSPRSWVAASVDPERSRESANRLDEKAAALEAKAEKLEAEAAACDDTKRLGRLDAANKRNMADRFRKDATSKRRTAKSYRIAVDAVEIPDPVDPLGPADPVHSATSAAANDLADQLARLAKLKTAGVLSDEEFSAAKARLLIGAQ